MLSRAIHTFLVKFSHPCHVRHASKPGCGSSGGVEMKLVAKIGTKAQSIVVGAVALAGVLALSSFAQVNAATTVEIFDNGWYSESN
jgi:hypothetical protein